MRQVHELIQGSKEWHDFRAKHFTASDAAAMLGMSKYKTRDQLLKEKATGFTPEIDAATQKRFDDGHAYEAACRPIIEKRMNTELYPATVSLIVDGLPMAASLDGWTMDETTVWEHKTANDDLAKSLFNWEIPDQYKPQLEQQLLVSGANEAVFTISKGTEDSEMSMSYTSNPKLREQIIEGWKQFKIDLENYQVRESVVEPIGRAPSDIPALVVKVSGNVLASNLAQFLSAALNVFESINTELNSDQDFADAEKTVKWCDDIEKKLALTKDQVMEQAADINEIVKTLSDLQETARSKRLTLKKIIDARKEALRAEIAAEAKAAWSQHMLDLASTLHPVKLPLIMCDIPGAMKGKRTIDTLRSAANDEVARAKIEANVIANKYQANLKIVRENTQHYQFLFNDLQSLVENNNPESLLAVIRQRIADHEQKERDRIEAEAQRIAAQKIEQERREREAKERAEREAAQRAEQQRIDAERKAQQEAAREAAAAVKPLEQAEPMPETIRQVVEADPVKHSVAQDHFRGAKKMVSRPTDAEIIAVVAMSFMISEETAIDWLEVIDLKAERKILKRHLA